MTLNPLTNRQARFAEAYATTGNGAESARIAGFSAKNAASYASTLLKLPEVQSAVEGIRADRNRSITDDLIRGGLLGEAGREGKGTSHAARVAAWRALADIQGLTRTSVVNGVMAGLSTIRIEIVGGGPNGQQSHEFELGGGRLLQSPSAVE